MRNSLVFVLALGMSSCAVSEEQMQSTVTIYYVPIGAQTFIPMTSENIEAHYVRYAIVSDDDRKFQRIMALIEKAGEGCFDDQFVRVKIILPDGRVIWVDNEGGVRRDATDSGLNSRELNRLQAKLEKITVPRTK